MLSRPTLALCALLALSALPARAADGLFVWNDPRAMAVKLATLDTSDPAAVTSIRVLLPLQSISVTQTAVASDGSSIGICHEIQDGNEGGWELLGFNARGKPTWNMRIGELGDQLTPFLGADAKPGVGHLFFYACLNGGATGRPGVLAFDIGLHRSQTNDDRIARIQVDGRSGKIIAADLRAEGEKSALKLGRNPADRMAKSEGGATVMNVEATFVFPDGGSGTVMWGTHPLRWKGEAAVTGHDFAWWLPKL